MKFAHDIPIPDNNIDTYLESIVDFVALEDCEDLHRFKKKERYYKWRSYN